MIAFTVDVEAKRSPREILEAVLDVDSWTSFEGWGPIPGVCRAEMTCQGDSVVGARIDVTNTDGSSHQETIVEFVPNEKLVMRMECFPPLLGKQRAARRVAEWGLLKWRIACGDRVTSDVLPLKQ